MKLQQLLASYRWIGYLHGFSP